MLSITGLATTDVKNKIPSFSNLVIKLNYDSKTWYQKYTNLNILPHLNTINLRMK